MRAEHGLHELHRTGALDEVDEERVELGEVVHPDVAGVGVQARIVCRPAQSRRALDRVVQRVAGPLEVGEGQDVGYDAEPLLGELVEEGGLGHRELAGRRGDHRARERISRPGRAPVSVSSRRVISPATTVAR